MAFLARWEPFVSSFLAKGIERVVLGEGGGGPGFGFVSRNVWTDARFRSVFSHGLPRAAGGGGVMAIQGGGFQVVASADLKLLGAVRSGALKHLVLARANEGSRKDLVERLGHLANRHARGRGWALYSGDQATLGGRFNAALELYSDEESADGLREALAASLAEAEPAEELRVETLREVLALP